MGETAAAGGVFMGLGLRGVRGNGGATAVGATAVRATAVGATAEPLEGGPTKTQRMAKKKKKF